MKYEVAPFCKKVLAYYRKYGRGQLPWRKTADPYRILVSEVMLQQTQVDRVIPFYKRFLQKFPDAKALAKAPLSEVLKEWSGLGYNRRGKFLREASAAIGRHHGGKVPSDYIALRALPGVGEYTAKAVRTFAFNEPEVMLETNIRTALIHELFPRGRKVNDERLTPVLSDALRYVESPCEWYWALMDYGTYIKKTHGNAARRSKVYTKQSAFEGSLRQVRGAILRELTARSRTEKALAKKTSLALSRITLALTALERDGIIKKGKASAWSIV
jgi:A/G-specific adenine glycosylase